MSALPGHPAAPSKTTPAAGAQRRPRPAGRREALAQALERIGYEILPFAGTHEKVLAHVPRAVRLSVTVTEAKGLAPTVELAAALARDGYDVAPHIAARLIRDGAHLDDVVSRLGDAGVHGIFVVAGDAGDAQGPYPDALSLLRALDARGHHFTRIGVGGYPEGHGRLPAHLVDQALRDKAGYATYIVTQLCFRAATTATWARTVREDGVRLPVQVGIPGAVNRQKLVRIAGRLGLGPSARFLTKQSGMLTRFFLPGGYSPDRLVDQLADHLTHQPDAAEPAALHGFHVFTFNELASTEAWRQARLGLAARDDRSDHADHTDR